MVRTASTDLKRAQELAKEWQPKVFNSEDAKEGATAFIEARSGVEGPLTGDPSSPGRSHRPRTGL